MITITWNVLVYALIFVCTLVFVLRMDNTPHWFGSNREWALVWYPIAMAIFTAIWGGIFWW